MVGTMGNINTAMGQEATADREATGREVDMVVQEASADRVEAPDDRVEVPVGQVGVDPVARMGTSEGQAEVPADLGGVAQAGLVDQADQGERAVVPTCGEIRVDLSIATRDGMGSSYSATK